MFTEKLSGFASLLVAIALFSCSPSETKKDDNSTDKKDSTEKKADSSQPAETQNWIDIQAQVSRMTPETTYENIVDALGLPYEEYATPSMPEEYVLFYNVPGVNGAMFWIMLDTQKKTFLYWSGEKHEK